MATIVIGALLLAYGIWVVKKKISDAKKGKFCSCGCEGCPKSSTKVKDRIP